MVEPMATVVHAGKHRPATPANGGVSGSGCGASSDHTAPEDLNTRCERAWQDYVSGCSPEPPCFRTFMNCVNIHKKYINSLHGAAKRGRLYYLCRKVRKKYFFKSTTFKLANTATVPGARRALINFVEQARVIIPTQDELKRQCDEPSRVTQHSTSDHRLSDNIASDTSKLPSTPELRPAQQVDATPPSYEERSTESDTRRQSRKRKLDSGFERIADALQQFLTEPVSETRLQLQSAHIKAVQLEMELSQARLEETKTRILELQLRVLREAGASIDELKRVVRKFGLPVD